MGVHVANKNIQNRTTMWLSQKILNQFYQTTWKTERKEQPALEYI